MYHLKGDDESFSENVVFNETEFLNQSYGHLSRIWPFLVNFAIISH